jgi:hypothetical protein
MEEGRCTKGGPGEVRSVRSRRADLSPGDAERRFFRSNLILKGGSD